MQAIHNEQPVEETPVEEAPAETPMESAGEGTELSDEEVEAIVASMKEHAIVAPVVEITDENWRESVTTPIGEVKMGENQKDKLFAKGREQQYGMLLETLGNPDIILEEKDKEENLFHERPSSYLFIKTFQKEDGSKYVHFESVTVSQEGMDISVSSHIIRENQLRNKVKSDRLLYKATALDEPAHPSAEQPTNEGVSLSSDGKDTQNSETQEENAENSEKWVDSSHRKTKAFADYKSVQTTEGQNEAALATQQTGQDNNTTGGTERTDNQDEGTAVEENSGNQVETSQDGTPAEQPIDDSDIDALIEDYKKKAAATNKIWSAWLADPSGKPADYGTTRDDEEKAYGRVREALAGVSEEKLAEMENTNYGDSLLNDLIKEERNRRNEQKEIEQRFVDGLAKQGEIGKPTKPVSIEKILPEFTSRDEQRPIMNCIYYDAEGYAVASDAYILIASKSQYDPKQEGKMVAAHKIKGVAEKGDEVEGKFMKWRNVISQAKANSAEIDLPRLRDFLAGVKELMKGSKEDATVQVRMPNGAIIGFEPEYLLKFVRGAEAMGVKEIEYIAPNRAITGRSEDGIVLLMPKKISADYGGMEFYYDLSDSSESLNDEKPTELFSIDEPKKKKTRKSLIGLHNIRADKLRKVLKKGGLANPSTAVIDIDKQDFTGYGEISLVMPSSLVDSRTGNNAGTYLGDAWTPTYPSVETMLSSEGDKKVEKIASENSDGNEEVKNYIKSRLNDFAEKNGERLWYLFLKQTGRDPVLSMKRTNTSEESYEKLKDLIDGGIIHKNELTKEESDRIADVIIDERFRKKDTEGMTPEALDFLIKSFNEKNLDENGILYFGVWNRFIESLIQDERTRKNPKIDFYDTEVEAQRRVYDEGLTGEYEQWKQSMFDDADIDERLFAGFTPSGTRRYMANTPENASKIMNKLEDTNSYDNNGLSATRASLLKKVKTLSDIRKNKELLKNGDEFKDEQERLSEELFSIIEQVSSMQKISDNPFINNDYAEARLQEAFTKRDPIKHLNDEYGYDIEKDSDLAKQINGFVEEVKSLPVKYFETKFRRPVQLNEFVAAVVPQDLPQDLKDGLQESGLTLYEYDPKDENRRREATLKATEDENIRFSVNNGTDGTNGTDAQQVAYNAVREALANAGIEVVEATEEDVKRLKDSRKQLKDSKGTIRGWVGNDGKIHLTKDGLTAETPIHEYTHLWAEALQMNNPELWEQIKGLLKGTPEWKRITSMKEYSNLKDDDRIAGEVLAHISGKKNAERMEAEAKRMIDEATTLEEAAKAANLLGRMRNALKKFWTWVGKTLLGKKGNINIDQVSNMVLSDLTNGVDPFHPRGGKRTNRTKRTDASVEGEMERIKREAQANGTFMKAPNGKPTKLTERQWLQVRTQAFKKWFMDWEKHLRIEKLRGSKSVSVVKQDYDGKYDLNADAAQQWILDNLRKEYQNSDTGEKISVSRVGAEEVTSHNRYDMAHLKSISKIPEMIENAIFIEEQPNTKENKKFDSYRYYVVGLNIDGEEYTAKIVIGVKQGKKYYDHRLTQMEKTKLVDLINQPTSDFTTEGNASLPPYIVGKDTKLSEILRDDSSKILDENGEPMVVYHGSPLNFTVFDNTKAEEDDRSSDTPDGTSFFSDNKEVADSYTIDGEGNAVEFDEEKWPAVVVKYKDGHEEVQRYELGGIYFTFLNIKNPLVVDANGKNWDAVEFDSRVVSTNEIARLAKEQGYDGVVIKDVVDGAYKNLPKSGIYATFNPNQIKSATDNNGEFDAGNPDIRFSIGDETDETDRTDVPEMSDEEAEQYDAGRMTFTEIATEGVLVVSKSKDTR